MSDTKFRCDGPGAETLAAQLAADERLQPGKQGYWRVWGARTYDVEPGDVVVTLDRETDTLVCEEIAETHDLVPRMRFTTVTGATFSIGHLAPGIMVFRPGTGNTLA